MSMPRSQASQANPPQILDALLSHYQEGAKPTLRSHLSSLLLEFPGLQVKLEAFAQSDGRPPSLFLQVGGTIPISFLQVIYNIPLVIWLSEDYPVRAPLVFVTPSPSMIIKTGHPLVDASGFVSSPLLQCWVYPPSNLVDLIRSLCVSFGHDPPLYSLMHPSHAHDVSTSPSSSLLSASPSPSESSTSALSTSASLLGPGLSSQAYPLHANGAAQGSIMPTPMVSTSTSTSLLGPGLLLPRFSSHSHVKEPSVAYQSQSAMAATSHHYYSPSVSIARASSSFTSAGYPASVSSHPPHVYGAGGSMAHRTSSTSMSASATTSASLLGPGQISQRPIISPFPAPQLATKILHHPSSLTQGNFSAAYDVRLPVAPHPSPSLSSSPLTSTSTSASLLGPGKVLQMHPLHTAKNLSSAYLPLLAPSASLVCPSSSGQWHPPHTYADGSLGQSHPHPTYVDSALMQWNSISGAGVSMAVSPSASTSASLLGAGLLSKRHTPHAHVGGSMVHFSHASTSAQASTSSSSSLVLGTLLQQLSAVDHAHHAAEEFNTSTSHVHNTGASASPSIYARPSNSILSISMPQNAGLPPTLSQQHSTPPAQSVQFSNPMFDLPDPPPDSRQSMIDTLVGRIQCDVDKIRKAKEIDMLDSMDIEGLLKQRQGVYDKAIQGLQQEKENLELQLQTLLINTDLLETWLVSSNKSDVNTDIDEVFEHCDGLSKQLQECVASDLAIEDALYCLGKAAEEGQLPVDSYLKYVKTLCREQFFRRATANKVRAAQGQ